MTITPDVKQTQGRFFQRIQGQLVLVLIVLLAATFLTQAYVFNEWYKSSRQAELQANLQIARAVAKNFNGFIEDVLQQEYAIGRTLSMPKLSAEDQRLFIEDNMTQYPAFFNLLWVSPEGVILISHLREIEGQGITDRKYYQDIVAGRDWSVSGLQEAKATGQPVIAFARGIRDKQGQLLGIAVASILADRLGEVLAIDRPKGGGHALVDSAGMLVYRYPSINPTWEQRNWLKDYPEFGEALKGKEVAKSVFAPFEGKNRLVAFTPVSSIGWAASAGRTEEIAMEAVVSQLLPQAILLFAITLAAFGAAMLFSRSIATSVARLRNHAIALGSGVTHEPLVPSGPVELKSLADSINTMAEELRSRETRLSEQREWLQVTLTSIGDAVLATDATGLVTFLNPVAEALIGWSLEEALGKPAQTVFRTINEKTHEPAEDIIERVLREERTIALANHTALTTRDGRVIPIEDSAAPIKDRMNNISGVVLVFHDVTERRRFLAALLESEQKNRFLADIIKFSSQPFAVGYPDGRLGLVNIAFEHLTGYSSDELHSIDWATVLTPPEWLPLERETLEELHRTGKPVRYVKEYIRKDGVRVPIELLVHLAADSDGEPQYYYSFVTDITERKQIEQALRESEEHHRSLFKNMLNGLAYCKMLFEQNRPVDFIYLNVNSAFEALTGLTNVVGKKVSEVIPGIKESDPELFAIYGRVALTCVPEQFEKYVEAMGMWFSVSVYSTQREHFVAVFDVITERKLMEDELLRSRDVLELRVQERTKELVEANHALSEKAEIIDLAHDAIIVRDAESRIIFWSRGARETYGFTCEEALGQVSNELLKTVFPAPIVNIVDTVLERGEWKGELRHTRANGERIIVDSRWAVQAGKSGEAAGYLEVNRDITSRKIIEDEFRKADRAFRTLSECNQAMVRQTEEMELLQQVCQIVVDVGGYRMAWVGFAENDENKTVLPIASAGYDHGYLDQAQITWADTERGRGPTGTAIRTGKIVTSQNALLNPAYGPWRSEGTRRGYVSSIALPLNVGKKVIGTLTIYASEADAFDEGEARLLSDLAENLAYGIASIRIAEQRRRSEEELRVYASRLELMNKELQDFAFAASHDLQEPLRKIQTFGDLAMKRCAPALDSAGKEYLDRVLNSANRMRQLLRDLLAFSKVATRSEPFQKLELGKMAREAADVFEASIEETGCGIEIEDLPVIEADESQILQLFQNLIGNSLKYRGSDRPSIRVYGKIEGKATCEICVEDNGIGFDKQFAEIIFKPFQRLHGRDEYDGTGMGLAICRKIVERHGGTIRAESVPGKGSTFIIRLPVKQARVESIGAGQLS